MMSNYRALDKMMADIKDDGREFHWSRPRMVGCVFGIAAAPIWLIFALIGREKYGEFAWVSICLSLLIAYVRPTRFRAFMQRLIPTTAEKEQRLDQDEE